MDTGAKDTLSYGNPEKFPCPEVSTDGYGGQSVRVKAIQLFLGISNLFPHENTVHVSPIPEYILGIDVLQALWLHTNTGEFNLWMQVVKATLWGHAILPIVQLPYWLLGGHDEFTATIRELEKVAIISATTVLLTILCDQWRSQMVHGE